MHTTRVASMRVTMRLRLGGVGFRFKGAARALAKVGLRDGEFSSSMNSAGRYCIFIFYFFLFD